MLYAFLEIAHWRTYIEWDWPLLPFPSTTTTLVGGRDPQWKHYYSYLLSTTLHSLPPLLTKYLTGRKQTRWECNYTLSLCHKPAVAWMWKHGSQLSTPAFYDSFFMNVHNPMGIFLFKPVVSNSKCKPWCIQELSG